MEVEQIAKVCHDANRSLCQLMGDHSQQPWESAPEWQQKSAIVGVKYNLENPNGHPEDTHISWMKQKIEDGWIYGPEKDSEKKTHPCLVPYSQLPLAQQRKDHLFKAIVAALKF